MARRKREFEKTAESHMTGEQRECLFMNIRRAGFEIDNDDNPRSTGCQVFLDPNDIDGGDYDGTFTITLIVEGLIFEFHNAQAAPVIPMLPATAARSTPRDIRNSAVVINFPQPTK